MNIAELFINLGVKGGDKTVGAFSQMQKGLKDTSSMALETKVALIGAVYAMERLFAASGQKGTDLTNFNAVVGVSTKTLQEYQYAARQVGVSNEAVGGTFKALQSVMTKTLMGEGAPKGLARVAQLTGSITPEDLKKFSEQPQLLLQRLQQYASKEKDKGLKNEVLKSFGVGDDMAAALNRQAFRPEVLSNAPTYGNKEVGQLDQANIAWSNLKNTIEMAVGHFNAKHGGELVEGLTKITDKVIGLAEALVKLSEKLHAMEWFGKMVEGWTGIFKGLTAFVEHPLDTIKEAASSTAEAVHGAAIAAGDAASEGAKKLVPTISDPRVAASMAGAMGGYSGVGFPAAKQPAPAPTVATTLQKTTINPVQNKTQIMPIQNKTQIIAIKSGATPGLPNPANAIKPTNLPPIVANKTQTVNVQQNLNFQHDGKDAQKVGDSTKKAVKDAFRQLPSQAQGT